MRGKVIIGVLGILLAVGLLLAGGEGDVEPESLRVKEETDYRIEVVTEKDEHQIKRPKEVHFVSPEGKVLKPLPINKTIVSGNKKYVLYLSDYKVNEKFDEIERILLNTKGEVRWKKCWKTYPGERRDPELLCPYWAEDISYDGSAVYVMYIDSLGIVHLAVYDSTGREITNVENDSELRNIEISKDGKIIGAMTGKSLGERKGYTGPYLFFLDVKTGKIKIVKAECGKNEKKWRGYFILSSSLCPPKNGKIRIGLQPLGKEYDRIPGGGVRTKDVSFDEIPDDLLEIFGGKR